MSEEQPTQNTQTEKKCKFTLLIILTIISLLFSVSSLVLSIITYNGGISIGQQGEDSNKISVRYDKGRSFEKASKKNKPIIVFFYTDWCGFCQRFAPTFDKVTKDANLLLYSDEYSAISEQATKRDYENIENIIAAIDKAKVRLKANVNFDVTIELMILAMKD